MVSTIQRDIERLRTATGGGGFPPCPVCGEDDWPPEPGDSYELIFVDPDDPEDEPCPECGRSPVVISFTEDSERRR